MKKYICAYMVVLSVIFLIIITNGFGNEQIIHSVNEADRGVVDGFAIQNSLFIYNIAIIFLLIIVSIVITVQKKNNLKTKFVILSVILLLLLFIPIGIRYTSGGIAGKNHAESILLKDFYKMFF